MLRIFTLFAGLMLAGVAQSAHAAESLLYHWQLDGDLTERITGTAGSFVGGTPVFTSSEDSLALDLTASGTWHGYVNTGLRLPSGNKTMIVTVKDPSFGDQTIWLGNQADVEHRFYLGDGSGAGNLFVGAGDNNSVSVGSLTSTDATAYHQYVMVQSGNRVETYQNGVHVGGLSFGNTTGTASGKDFEIGRGGGTTPPLYAESWIDDVAIVGRALSASEVQTIATDGLASMFLVGPADQTLTQGLAAYWNFDGNLNDHSGNANHANALNGASIASTDGRFGGALSLDGVDDFVEVAHSDSLDFGTGSITMAGWMKLNESPGSGSEHDQIMIGRTADGGDVWSARVLDSGGFRGGMQNGGSNFASTYTTVQGSTNFEDQQWHHFVMVLDRDANMQHYYIDGVKVHTRSINFGHDIDADIPLIIGADRGFRQFANGMIDDMALWNRSLTAVEVSYLFNNPLRSPTIPAPLAVFVIVPGLAWLASPRTLKQPFGHAANMEIHHV